jgi:ribosome-binding protein aMBF1 (putative translation factor)
MGLERPWARWSAAYRRGIRFARSAVGGKIRDEHRGRDVEKTRGISMKVDGANLAAARERVFMSQEELAEALGMNPYVIIGLETSERTEVRDNLGKDLAEILFVSRAELTSFPDPPKPVDKRRPDLEDLAEEE